MIDSIFMILVFIFAIVVILKIKYMASVLNANKKTIRIVDKEVVFKKEADRYKLIIESTIEINDLINVKINDFMENKCKNCNEKFCSPTVMVDRKTVPKFLSRILRYHDSVSNLIHLKIKLCDETQKAFTNTHIQCKKTKIANECKTSGVKDSSLKNEGMW